MRRPGSRLPAASPRWASPPTRRAGRGAGFRTLFYIPIFLAAFVYGPVGGVAAGLLAGACAFLVPVDVAEGTEQETMAWLVRSGAFVAAGALVGGFSAGLRARVRELRRVTAQVVFAFVRAIDSQHPYTAEHSEKVAHYAVAIARQLGLPAQEIDRVRWAALLHDVGKLSVPTTILDKPGPLDTRELPADLASVLRDQSVVVPQDAAVFELIAAWAKAPTATASAEVTVEPDMGLVDALYRQTQMASSTTPAGCY